ncbi:alpha-amylase/4-alpha-glucanotransferase domain-containing protein [Sulfurimonas sp.]
MKKVSLLFGIHMHQPVDNFDEAIENAVKLCYAPFFETMRKYPDFKFALHCSGWLLEKIRLQYPALFENMQFLTKSGSIEWFSGAYYEPVLSAIPSKDKIAQITKLTQYIEKHFDCKPRGLWLAERVWENSLLCDLHACGIEYVMLDDYHFISNGYDREKMNGYYTTEENAKELKLFPISKSLRYALPFSQAEDSIASLLQDREGKNTAAIFFDDAEKFGLWPKTNNWVYGQKWLEKFIQAVLSHQEIVTQHYHQYTKDNKSLGLAYLNNCSYFEMSQWSLQLKDAHRLEALKQQLGEEYVENEGSAIIKGGIWKNFFVKYHESNYIHKRMLQLSEQQKDFDRESLDLLYKAQTNDGLWHGVFGGFYLPSLRDNTYRYLLELQKRNQKKEKNLQLLDINKDGYAELQVLTKELSIVISPKNGAQLIELGSLSAFFNWQNTIMRREELYHHTLQKHAQKHQNIPAVTTIHEQTDRLDDSLHSELVYDRYQKNSFIEHFALEPFSLENFKALTFKERGDFVNKAFAMKNKAFVAKGSLFLEDEVYPAKLKKKYSFADNTIVLKSKFTSQYEKNLYIAQEFNLHFAHPHKVTCNGQSITKDFLAQSCNELSIVDDFTQKKLLITSDQEWSVFATILNTVSKSEQGFDKIAQQISFLFSKNFSKKLHYQFTLEVLNV